MYCHRRVWKDSGAFSAPTALARRGSVRMGRTEMGNVHVFSVGPETTAIFVLTNLNVLGEATSGIFDAQATM